MQSVRDEVAMREHDALGHAGGSGREGQDADVVEGVDLGAVGQRLTLELPHHL